MNVVMSIAGSDSGAGAGIQADLKTILVHDLWGVSVITTITAQNTKEINKIYQLPLDIIEGQLDALISDFPIHVIKIGMLYSTEIIEVIFNKLKNLKIPIVLDPILKSTTGKDLITGNYLDVLKNRLIPISSIITPNIMEAEKLSNTHICDLNDVKNACKIIKGIGSDAVLVKGGHLNEEEEEIFDTLYYQGKFYFFRKMRIIGNYHGIGCTFSSSIACNLASGNDLVDSVKLSETYIENVIANSNRVTKGLIPVNQKY